MKSMSLLLLSLTLTTSAIAQSISLNDYNFELTDISEKNLSKEKLFSYMDRDFVKVGSSICSNRALMWAYDFKRFNHINTAKVFLFYTQKTGEVGRKTWWYHVSPVINEKGTMYAMDAGFPSDIDKPLTISGWMNSFIGTDKCKEINAGENELIERMFSGRVFPETTRYGKFDCYYKVVPEGYWTPASVAMNLLGKDSEGKPIRFERETISKSEVYEACVEATTSSLGRVFGSGKKKCDKYMSRR